MNKATAEYLAASLSVPHSHVEYRARKLHGQWLVWCDASDHAVEIDAATIEQAAISLIAAAPDMLAALKHVQELYADIEIVRAAIAKAEGGQP